MNPGADASRGYPGAVPFWKRRTDADLPDDDAEPLEPRALLRTGEAPYRTLGLAAPGIADDALVEAMVAHPVLIERPILVRGTRAVIGRPTERLLTLLD